MIEITETCAVEIARNYFKLEESVASSVWKVTKLANQDDSYFLVVFGEINKSIAVAVIGAAKGEVRVSALLSGNSSHLSVNKEDALELCNADENSQIELVWQPGRLSQSMLYPFWKVHTPSGIRYINQEGVVSDRLDILLKGG